MDLWHQGQIVCPARSLAARRPSRYNSNVVQGVNTAWDNTLIGRQFRTGLNNPIYTIMNVDSPRSS